MSSPFLCLPGGQWQVGEGAALNRMPMAGERLRGEGDTSSHLSRRALALGLVLVVPLCVAVEYGEMVVWIGELVASSLMLIVTCLLLLLLGANLLLKRWRSVQPLSRPELLYLFAMLTAAGSVAGVGMVQFIVPMLGHLFHYATPENGWAVFQPYVPTWVVPHQSVLQGFYKGQTTFFTEAHLRGWLSPIAAWSGFVFTFLAFMLCLSLLLRRQWVERERLTFPIVYFPLELTREDSTVWRDRLLWLGFMIPVVLQSLASLNYLVPSVPYLPLKPSPELNIGRMLPPGPLEPLSGLTLAFYPMALGIAYFAQLDVLFSCWFFYWAARSVEIVSILLGLRGGGGLSGTTDMPYLGQQSLGAYWALGAVALWLARGEITLAIRQAFSRTGERRERASSARAVLAGLAASSLLLLGFSLALGIPLHIILLFFTIYFLVVIGFTRIRAQAGLPWLFGPNHPPHIFMTWAVGPTNISSRALTGLNYLQWFDWDYRCTAMPHQMEALKMSASAGLRDRDMVKGILLASALAIVVSYATLLAIFYHYGAESGKVDDYRSQWAGMPIGLLATWNASPAGVGWSEIAGGVVGASVVIGLTALHARWLWWPFHPVGYALCGTFTLDWLWSPLFVIWLAKYMILRYGGIRLYRRGIPFAVGLILGDYVVAGLWALVGLALGQQMYSTFWG